MTGPGSFLWIYGAPLGLAAMGCVGVTAALMGDGLWDGLSWAALGLMTGSGLWPALRCGRHCRKAFRGQAGSLPDRR
jgi:hypothetical protein